MATDGSGASRAGGDGLHNEDVFVVEDGLGLYVVCDGASGTPAGEVAARVAADTISDVISRSKEGVSPEDAVVEAAMHAALSAVAASQRSDPELRGLATTTTMLIVHGRTGVIGHRGDSRAYLIRRDRGFQLTVDHELAAEASGEAGEAYDVFSVELAPGDTIVLCTDGAEEVVLRRDLVRIAGDLTPRLLASRIVSMAHREAPDRDATAVVVRVRGERERGWLELSGPPRDEGFGHTLQIAR